ncbi:DUF2189 domain-containing protein [Cognatishimia activa]|uniref:Putative integral membrane protein n=1 Tax=Cognatishimia activa TaxID=1715691 RepID=A0A0N7MBF3_9RHOB|nr:DUF2189 domain-containing protein [Cognatishimia activa]CUJ28626.1 putative integral membrane protein [Cognatishimia activa]CUK25248.1 putative integral membrane protein [Cognatishimia activa]
MNEAASKPLGVPELGAVGFSTLIEALKLGWQDFRALPVYGLIFAAVYFLGGWLITWVTVATGQTYWLVFAAIGFPLLGPFAATGLYEASHQRQMGRLPSPRRIFGVVLDQGRRQLPSLCAVIVIVFLFWFFLAHMIFALFLGLSTMTNVSSSLEVYFTTNGLMMLGFGSVVGAAFALLLYMLVVISIPLLLDREVDFVTAMITSFKTVSANFVPMVVWGAGIAVAVFMAMLPGFLGLFLILPVLGHASWHLYALIRT